jgi:Ca-activated chloride channel homolog
MVIPGKMRTVSTLTAGSIDSPLRASIPSLRFLTLALLPTLAGLFFCKAQEVSAPTIRVDVSRVNVGVTVTDHSGKFVEGLRKSDFHVFDNGVEQPIAGFLANDDPAQVVLMLECGPSMYLFGKESVQKADMLVTNLAPNDRVAVVCYSSGATIQSGLDADQSASRLALRDLNFGIGSADLNLSKSLLAVFGWLSTIPGKKAVVLIGSGVDTSPPDDANAFRANISASDVRVLAVSTSRELKKPPQKHKRTRDEKASRAEIDPILKDADTLLRTVTTATGGRVYFPKSTKDYEKTYIEIAQIVRHEYNLAFSPQTFDGKLHTLTVAARRGARVDNRQAYLAPSAPAN